MGVRRPTSFVSWLVRGAAAVAIAAVGVATALGCDHYWQSKIPPQQIVGGGYPAITAPMFNSVTGDLLFGAMPFVVLAGVALISRGRLLVALEFSILVVLTVWEYRANAGDSTSTAGIVFLWSWFAGIAIVVAAIVHDARSRLRAA